MENINDIPNLRQIKVKYISPTDHKGSRVCIYEPKRYNSDKTKRVYLSYNYAIGNIQDQAYQYLIDKGFNVVSRASEFENYILFVDNWADDFIEIDSGLIRTY